MLTQYLTHNAAFISALNLGVWLAVLCAVYGVFIAFALVFIRIVKKPSPRMSQKDVNERCGIDSIEGLL